jgi:hypothetical protein
VLTETGVVFDDEDRGGLVRRRRHMHLGTLSRVLAVPQTMGYGDDPTAPIAGKIGHPPDS